MTLSEVHQIFDSIRPDKYGCHQWPNVLVGYYGRANIQRHRYYVHRLALERKLGRPIKPGYDCLHSCDCPSCVNPKHLREGTDKDNRKDMMLRNPDAKKKYLDNPEYRAKMLADLSKAREKADEALQKNYETEMARRKYWKDYFAQGSQP